MKFHVPDMSCGHCTAAIKKAILAKDPTAGIEIETETRHVSVSSNLGQSDVQEAILDAGYEAAAA
ncbi:copper chaperone [Litoreibacter halocynthiae]|uniref:Copper chaperone n=1 Tax=Litoreibacter halocynthiae TaxID=1242689 RepID=A0A4R7LEK2_9RHOB|nr:heavy-metal-associated domain-containing protein [Litoreibacter halocynthiae]TDT72711.1 copper chaperone [Litoreibacter halocynthiae]